MKNKSTKTAVLAALMVVALSASAMACGAGDYSGDKGSTGTETSGEE